MSSDLVIKNICIGVDVGRKKPNRSSGLGSGISWRSRLNLLTSAGVSIDYSTNKP